MLEPQRDPARIDWFLNHAVENVYPSREALRTRLLSGPRLTVYLGIDPTANFIHMGNALSMKKLAELQKLGHRIILLIGDFTAMIGDPTDKSATRTAQTREQVLENCRLYKEQASRILSFEGENPVELKFNSEWLAKMSFSDVVELSSHFTVQQMMERDMFEKRFRGVITCPNESCGHKFVSPIKMEFKGPTPAAEEQGTGNFITDPILRSYPCPKCHTLLGDSIGKNGFSQFVEKNVTKPKPIYLHEFLYPLMQGYDSVAMDVDLEIGGNDQTFNMLAGRTLMREMKNKEKFVVTGRLLADASGKKMGKSEGNAIALSDSPEDIFGKVMSWTDEMLIPGFEVCTDLPQEEINKIKEKISQGENPMTFKKQLGKLIVAWLSNEAAANEAEAHFSRVHQQGEQPEEVREVSAGASSLSLVDALVLAALVDSKTDARRQIEQGGVKVNDMVVTDVKAMVDVSPEGTMIQKGKRFFVKLVV